MIDRREAALAAFFAKLAAVAGVTAERNRDVAIDVADMPFVVMFDGGHEIDRAETLQDDYRMTVEVEIYVAASTTAEVGPAFNAVWAAVAAAVSESPSLDDVVTEVRQRSLTDPELLQDENEKPQMSAAASFDVFFSTVEDDPLTAP